MKNLACVTLLLSVVLLIGRVNHAAGAETNAVPARVLAPTEFQLTSQPPAVDTNRSRSLPPEVVRSNNARLLERRAAILKDLSNRSNSNGAVVVVHSNRFSQLKGRIDELHHKKADGTITTREQRQLEQLELLAARTATNQPPPAGAVSIRPEGQKAP